MTPELRRDSLPAYGRQKAQIFIRIGPNIICDSPRKRHDSIAKRSGLISRIEKGKDPDVDDGGFLYFKPRGVIEISGRTHHCKIVGDFFQARQETVEIIGKLTGREVRSY